MSTAIDWTQPVQTRDGTAVRILATDLEGIEPVIGVLANSTATQRWGFDGAYLPGGGRNPHAMDLINVRSSSGKSPLCSDDVMPGTIFRHRREPDTILWPMWVSKWGIQLGDGTTHDWAALQCHYEILFPDNIDWQPCEEQWP